MSLLLSAMLIVTTTLGACMKNNGGELNKQSEKEMPALKEVCEDEYSYMHFYSVRINMPKDIFDGKVWEYSTRILFDYVYRKRADLAKDKQLSENCDYDWKIDSICKALPFLELKRYDILVIKEISTVFTQCKPHRIDMYGNGIYIDNIFAPIITTYTSLRSHRNDDWELYNWDRRGIYHTAVADGGFNNGVLCTGYRLELDKNNIATLKYYISDSLYGEEGEKMRKKLWN